MVKKMFEVWKAMNRFTVKLLTQNHVAEVKSTFTLLI